MSGAHSGSEEFRAKEEEFYRDLWSREHWSRPTPNPDEQARADKVVHFIREYVLPTLSERKAHILDLGCGRGWLTNVLSAFGEVIGVDPVSAGVERARELFPKLEFRCLESTELLQSLGAGSFDLVVSSEVIEHVDRPQQPAFLGNIFSLLAPGGFAILTTPRGELQERWARSQVRRAAARGVAQRRIICANWRRMPASMCGRLIESLSRQPWRIPSALLSTRAILPNSRKSFRPRASSRGSDITVRSTR